MASRWQLQALTALAALAFLAADGPWQGAVAQGIEGTVTHEVTGEPLPGVLVSVLQLGGARVRGVLTDGTGSFVAEVPSGRYRLRAERIGLRTATTDPFDVDALDVLTTRIEMSERPVEISGLVVDSRVQSCRLEPRVATRIQRWWSEIRTALDVSAALQRERFGRFLLERFQREWDEDLQEVVASSRQAEVSVSTRPFVSAPADELMTEGFVQGDFGLGREYFGPDADVILSSSFLAAHCFSLVEERGRDHQLGLHFEPIEGREIADIEGTLWVDTTTAELRDLDFGYVNVEGPEADEAGGNIVFEHLPSGAWIVSDWYIRMPKTGLRGRSSRLTTLGYYDGGGSVTELTPPEPGGAVGTVRGVVADRLRGGGLARAVVTVLGTTRQFVTDEDGSFWFFQLPAGTHYLAFSHAEVDAWGLGSGYVRVDVPPGESIDVELSVPEFERAALDLCLGEGVEAETVVVGHLVDPDQRAQPWRAVQLVYEGPRRLDYRQLNADELGRFVACSVPAGETVTVRANLGTGFVAIADFVAREGEITYREVRLPR